MEKDTKLFDVCVVCALPEEARAFLEIMQQGEGPIEERISPRYRSSYRFATIKNNKGELLNLHISWPPRYGPQAMILHLSQVLEEWQPRIAIMTGICAGDSQQVHLGDLVAAERTFTYDNGKFTLNSNGRRVHLHDTLTYQLDANILQFLGLFDEWEPLVAALERPLSPSEQRKTTCHIKAMASGSAVRADAPFKDVQAPLRGTVAIDLEGAAFGYVMSHHPLIRWLVVKGVCDYADRAKNDAYHDYAAHASALYALSFIRAFVTNERLPPRDGALPATRVESPEITPTTDTPKVSRLSPSRDKRYFLFSTSIILIFIIIGSTLFLLNKSFKLLPQGGSQATPQGTVDLYCSALRMNDTNTLHNLIPQSHWNEVQLGLFSDCLRSSKESGIYCSPTRQILYIVARGHERSLILESVNGQWFIIHYSDHYPSDNSNCNDTAMTKASLLGSPTNYNGGLRTIIR